MLSRTLVGSLGFDCAVIDVEWGCLLSPSKMIIFLGEVSSDVGNYAQHIRLTYTQLRVDWLDVLAGPGS